MFLDDLYKALRKWDQDSAIFLSEAFTDAVEFYGLDATGKGFEHFRSLEGYLSKVGGGMAFQALRYWPIEDSPKGENPIPYVWLPIYREILCALSCIFSVDNRITVSERVEFEVTNKVSEVREFSEITYDNLRIESLPRYRIWLENNQGAFRFALKKAFRDAFKTESEDVFWCSNLRSAYQELKRSDDPAVKYFIGTFSYLPKGSQPRDPYAIPRIKWLDKLCRNGSVNTPIGVNLGYVERNPDGAWAITVLDSGLVQVTKIAECLEDAKHYLVNRLTSKFPFKVNGKPKELRIVREPRIAGDAAWTADLDFQEKTTIKLKLWDDRHGLLLEDQISFEYLPKRGGFKRLYEGSVTEVKGHRVTIVGTEVYT